MLSLTLQHLQHLCTTLAPHSSLLLSASSATLDLSFQRRQKLEMVTCELRMRANFCLTTHPRKIFWMETASSSILARRCSSSSSDWREKKKKE